MELEYAYDVHMVLHSRSNVSMQVDGYCREGGRSVECCISELVPEVLLKFWYVFFKWWTRSGRGGGQAARVACYVGSLDTD